MFESACPLIPSKINFVFISWSRELDLEYSVQYLYAYQDSQGKL